MKTVCAKCGYTTEAKETVHDSLTGEVRYHEIDPCEYCLSMKDEAIAYLERALVKSNACLDRYVAGRRCNEL